MATFKVDTDSLRTLHDRLVAIHGELMGTRRAVSGYEGRLGGSELDRKLEDFCGHWDHGLNQLETHMAGVLQRLLAAADAYEKCEQEILNATPAGAGGGG
jgi:hypothetical protein